VPRPAPEFTIVDPEGKQIHLSRFKGHVVVIEFLLTNCPHCQRVAQMIGRLHREMSGRFEAIAVAFDNNLVDPMVTDFSRRLGLSYPIGSSSAIAVDRFLGRGVMERLMVPQIIVIDRAGVIRAQSHPQGETDLESEVYLRTLIHHLLE
jgi:peroxiredoxin